MGVWDYIREAWDREVECGNEWTVTVGQASSRPPEEDGGRSC